jgi:hypothetical protein
MGALAEGLGSTGTKKLMTVEQQVFSLWFLEGPNLPFWQARKPRLLEFIDLRRPVDEWTAYRAANASSRRGQLGP